MTKTFSRYLLDVGVAYRENVDEVIAILREIDAEMRQDPTFGQWIIAPIDILGLDRFEDSAVIIRARLITRRVKQWEVGREFNRRMKAVFDQRGIEIPFPHQTIYWGQPKEGPPLPLHLVTSGTPRAQSQERIEAARSNAVVQPFDQDANGHDSEAKMKK
jgi:small conductance mechanosensitive channel